MSSVSRAYTFTDGTDAYGSQVESEFTTIFNAWNNHDAGTSIWTSLKAVLLTMSGNIVMATNKITGLGNGTAAQDAATVTQLKVLQVVTATNTTSTTTSSTSYVDTALTATITPTSASNRILVMVSTNGASGANERIFYGLKRGSDLVTPGFQESQQAGTAESAVSFVYVDSPASTSATVYIVRIKSTAGGSITDNNRATTAAIVLMEVV